jgi:hypothetical protein
MMTSGLMRGWGESKVSGPCEPASVPTETPLKLEARRRGKGSVAVLETALKTRTSSRLIRSSRRRTASTLAESSVRVAIQLLLTTDAPTPPGARRDLPVRSRS